MKGFWDSYGIANFVLITELSVRDACKIGDIISPATRHAAAYRDEE